MDHPTEAWVKRNEDLLTIVAWNRQLLPVRGETHPSPGVYMFREGQMGAFHLTPAAMTAIGEPRTITNYLVSTACVCGAERFIVSMPVIVAPPGFQVDEEDPHTRPGAEMIGVTFDGPFHIIAMEVVGDQRIPFLYMPGASKREVPDDLADLIQKRALFHSLATNLLNRHGSDTHYFVPWLLKETS